MAFLLFLTLVVCGGVLYYNATTAIRHLEQHLRLTETLLRRAEADVVRMMPLYEATQAYCRARVAGESEAVLAVLHAEVNRQMLATVHLSFVGASKGRAN